MAGIVMVPNDETYNMQCFPLYSLLMAAGNRTVNYLSLDIEGAEFMVRWGSDHNVPYKSNQRITL